MGFILSWLVSQINFTSSFIEWYCEEVRSKLMWRCLLTILRFMVKKLTFTSSYEIYCLIIIIISKTNNLSFFKKWFKILLAINRIYRNHKNNKTMSFLMLSLSVISWVKMKTERHFWLKAAVSEYIRVERNML